MLLEQIERKQAELINLHRKSGKTPGKKWRVVKSEPAVLAVPEAPVLEGVPVPVPVTETETLAESPEPTVAVYPELPSEVFASVPQGVRGKPVKKPGTRTLGVHHCPNEVADRLAERAQALSKLGGKKVTVAEVAIDLLREGLNRR